MNEPIRLAKKPSGCWWWSGCLLTTVSTCLILLTVSLIIDSEKKLDEKRDEYTASHQEYEEALRVYEADSAYFHAQYERILTEMEAATHRNDSTLVKALEDSLRNYAEPEFIPRGVIGVNIGAAFYVLFIIIMLIPFVIGLILLFYYRYKKRKYADSQLL